MSYFQWPKLCHACTSAMGGASELYVLLVFLGSDRLKLRDIFICETANMVEV